MPTSARGRQMAAPTGTTFIKGEGIMEHEDVNRALLAEFPDFTVDDDDFENPYIVAGNFDRFILEAYNNGKKDIYRKGLHFIERLYSSESNKTRELATVGYLESLMDWPNKGELFNDFGPESKKWWIKLHKFWSGDILALNREDD